MTSAFAPAQPPDDLLLCLSHLRWDFVLQRPQHLLKRATKQFQVVFVEEPVFEDGAEPHLRLQRRDGVTLATPVLAPGTGDSEVLVKGQIERLLTELDHRRRVVWYYTPMALPLARDLAADCIVYDCMDELSAFLHAPPSLRERERDLLAECDLVFTGGQSLYEAKRPQHAQVHCFPSSIDTAHFAVARQLGPVDPPDQADIPHPRVGFFGVIDERLDLALVGELARQRPGWHFVMLGPLAKIDPASLPQAPNLHWLGRKDYAELPAYLRGWDAGFMPFAINAATRFISPTKTPEFLAAGLPVVSTPIRDVVASYGAAGLVQIAADAETMGSALETSLMWPEPGWLTAVDRQLASSSWDETWNRMHALIARTLADAASRPATALGSSLHV